MEKIQKSNIVFLCSLHYAHTRSIQICSKKWEDAAADAAAIAAKQKHAIRSLCIQWFLHNSE